MSAPVAAAPVIWWCRRDLRVDDNPALQAALATGGTLVGFGHTRAHQIRAAWHARWAAMWLLAAAVMLYGAGLAPPAQVPVFIWAPEEEGQFQQGRYSRWWTKQSVLLFSELLDRLGSRLIIRRSSESAKGLMQVVHDTGARAVFFNHLYDPISLVRDHEVRVGGRVPAGGEAQRHWRMAFFACCFEAPPAPLHPCRSKPR
jgi:deoxyribodipyrimidine photolyase